jgi:hypothetical protein
MSTPVTLSDTPTAWAKQRKPRKTEEADFQLAVVQLAKLKGLRFFYVPDSRKCPAGWPDLVVWGPGGALGIENKTETGDASDIQLETHDQLRAAGVQVVIRRPHDLASGLIAQDLSRLAKPVDVDQRAADIALLLWHLVGEGGRDSDLVQAFTRLIAPPQPFVIETPKLKPAQKATKRATTKRPR